MQPLSAGTAVARCFLVLVEEGKKHVLVAVEVAERTKAIAVSLVAHSMNEKMTEVHCDNASRVASVARPLLPAGHYDRDLEVHRAANSCSPPQVDCRC